MIASIIICTQNRAPDLKLTLESLSALSIPDYIISELIVVDNASSDDTRQVVSASQLDQMPIRYFREEKRGQSYARNTGLTEAQGEVILFTDDDIRISDSWIKKMTSPILSNQVDAVAGGVTIAPHLERDWMQGFHRACLAATERIDPKAPGDMIGANMAFSRRVLDRVPKFDCELGPGRLGFADDTLFSWQLLKAGFRIGAALEATVEHHFDETRLQKQSFLSTAKKLGRSSAYIAYHWEHRAIAKPKRRLLIWLFMLWMLRSRMPSGWRNKEGIGEQEFRCVSNLYFYRQYLTESKRVRNYDKLGLVKLEVAEVDLIESSRLPSYAGPR